VGEGLWGRRFIELLNTVKDTYKNKRVGIRKLATKNFNLLRKRSRKKTSRKKISKKGRRLRH